MKNFLILAGLLLILTISGNAQRLNLTNVGLVDTYTVATLPASGNWAGRVVIVSDATSAGSCTVGGGSAYSLCTWTGAAWAALGDGGSGVSTSGDSATAFFPTGTIEHERGGLEADVSAYSGLVKISGGATSQAAAGTDYLAPAGNGSALTGITGSQVGVTDTSFDVIVGTTAQTALDSVDDALLRARATGILSGGGLTNLGGGVVRIAAGEGAILDITTPATPTYYAVTWAQTDLDLSAVATATYYVYVTNAGTVTSTTTLPTQADYRDRIYLWRVSIRNNLYSADTAIPQPTQQLSGQVYDIFRALGFIKSGLQLSAASTDLSVAVAAGSVYQAGANFFTDPKSPHQVSISAKVPATFRHVDQDGDLTSDITQLDVANYDLSGTVTAIPGASTRAQIFTVMMFAGNGGTVRILRGQSYYTNIEEARVALTDGSYAPTIPTAFLNAGVLGWIIAEKGATNLSDGTQLFITANKFGLAGGAISSAGTAPVLSVNGETGAVVLDAAEINAATTDDDFVTLTGAQTIATGTKTLTAKLDAGGGTVEIPNSITLPGTCVVGEIYMDTDATSGQRIYACESTNTWALQGDGGGAGADNLGSGDPGANGLMARTALDTTSARTITGDAEITVANGDGVAGNPTLAIAAALTRDTEWDTLAEINSATTDDDAAGLAAVQTFATGTKTVTAKFDFGGGTLEVPNGTTLPGTCAIGDQFMDTDATSGQRLYLCESTNTWALQGDGGGGGGDNVTVNGVAADTTADLDDTATISWTLVDGGAGGPDQARAAIVADSVGPTQIDETAIYDFSSGTVTLPSGTAFGSGTTPFNLTGYTDDIAPAAPGTANQFTAYVDRSSGFLSWIINGGSAQTAVTTGGTQTLTNKTLTTPTIGSFTNATHDHTNAAGGGQIAYSALTGTPTIYNQTIEDEDTPLTQTAVVNFTGAGVTCSNGTGQVDCTIPGGGASLTVEEADAAPSVASVSTIQFDQADGFSVTDETGGQVQVDLTLTDAHVPDTITASNYLPLAGGTLTGQVVADNLGVEFEESDTNPACAAGNYNIYADLSETTLKKCINGVATDLDTGGSGGDSIEIEDGNDAGTFTAIDTTARYDDSGDINFAVADGGPGGPDVVTATVRADSVALTTDTTGNYVQQVADGTGIDGSVNSEGGTYTPTLDLTEVNNVTFGDNTQATITHTIDPTGTTSPVWSYSDGVANLSAGALQVGGVAVLTAAGAAANYVETFSAQTSITMTNAEHGFGHGSLLVGCIDSNDDVILPFVDINQSTYTVTVTFANATTGKCFVNGSSGTGATVEDTEMANESFGDFTCTGAEDGCTLNTDSVSTNEIAANGVGSAEIVDGSVTRDEVEAELRTDTKCFTLFDPGANLDAATMDIDSIYMALTYPITVTKISCESNGGDAVINLQRDDGTPANIASSNITCGTTPTAGTIDAAEDNIAAGEEIDFEYVTSGTNNRINVCFEYTID